MEFPKPLILTWARRILPVLFGASGGFAYYYYVYYVGCVSGTCPITSNPWSSTLCGAVIGFFLGPGMKKSQEGS
jgi:hypothetical protein